MSEDCPTFGPADGPSPNDATRCDLWQKNPICPSMSEHVRELEASGNSAKDAIFQTKDTIFQTDLTMTQAPTGEIWFDGKTYDPAIDRNRLSIQLGRVFEIMSDGKWWTLRALAYATNAPEASVSARLRDLRKRRFGAYTVAHRRHGEKTKGQGTGTWEYRLSTNDREVVLAGRKDA